MDSTYQSVEQPLRVLPGRAAGGEGSLARLWVRRAESREVWTSTGWQQEGARGECFWSVDDALECARSLRGKALELVAAFASGGHMVIPLADG